MIQYAVERGIQGHKLAKSLGFTTLRLFEYYLPPGLDIVPDVGLQVAESLAPDPTTRLTSFLSEEMAKEENRLPAAGLCALIGLLAEHHLRLALKSLGGSVAGPSGGTLVNLQGAVIRMAREFSRPVGTLGRDVNRLAGIRDLASHGHLNEISIADVDEAYRLLTAIEHDLRAMLTRW